MDSRYFTANLSIDATETIIIVQVTNIATQTVEEIGREMGLPDAAIIKINRTIRKRVGGRMKYMEMERANS